MFTSDSMAGPSFPPHLQTLFKQSLMYFQRSEILGAAKTLKLRLASPQQKTMTSIAYEAPDGKPTGQLGGHRYAMIGAGAPICDDIG